MASCGLPKKTAPTHEGKDAQVGRNGQETEEKKPVLGRAKNWVDASRVLASHGRNKSTACHRPQTHAIANHVASVMLPSARRPQTLGRVLSSAVSSAVRAMSKTLARSQYVKEDKMQLGKESLDFSHRLVCQERKNLE